MAIQMNQGWIGNWSPGIGDPTLGSWITVALYAWAAWECHRIRLLGRQGRLHLSFNERIVWRVLMAGMITLGINKQLDLQSALTELVRVHALENGWYSERRQFQQAFVAAVPILRLTVLTSLVVLVWNAPVQTLWTCAGAAGLVVFVAVRAASFRHVDERLGWHLAGLRLGWIIEIGPLLIISLGSRKRTQVRK